MSFVCLLYFFCMSFVCLLHAPVILQEAWQPGSFHGRRFGIDRRALEFDLLFFSNVGVIFLEFLTSRIGDRWWKNVAHICLLVPFQHRRHFLGILDTTDRGPVVEKTLHHFDGYGSRVVFLSMRTFVDAVLTDMLRNCRRRLPSNPTHSMLG